MKQPFVSIIINCFNGEKFLKKCIQSTLNQTYQNFEVIFVDNNSTDKSKEILSGFSDIRIKYFFSKKKLPLGNARNYALEKCKGDLITFLDVDDWYSNDKLELQVNEFLRDNETGLVFTNYFQYNNKSKKKFLIDCKRHEKSITQNLIDDYNIGIITIMVKNDLIKALKFHSDYNFVEDFDMVIRLSFITKFKFIENPTAFYRIHDNNLSKVKLSNYIEEYKLWISNFDKLNKNREKFVFNKLTTHIKLMEIKLKIINGKRLSALKEIIFCDFNKDIIKKLKYLLSIFLPLFLIRKFHQGMF